MTYDPIRQELEDGIPSTQSEWDRADALQRGQERPDQAWVLTDRDQWHKNPFYQGPPQPHPEEYHPDMEAPQEPLDDTSRDGELKDALLEAFDQSERSGDAYCVWLDGKEYHVRSDSESEACINHGWTYLCEVRCNPSNDTYF